MNLILESNNINLPKSSQKRDNHDRDIQQERGCALIETVSKPKACLIVSCALNHMMASKESFSSLEFDKSIPIHMGDDSTIISKGKGTVNIEHDGFLMFYMYPPWPPTF